MQNLKRLLLLAAAIASTGCVSLAVGTATLAVKSGPRAQLRPLAEAGDADAQYRLGKSYCCMGVGFNTQTATQWLCKSAHQDNADAMYELGRIYDGDLSRTADPGQKLIRALKVKKSPPNAYMWFSLAVDGGHPKAGERLARLEQKVSAGDLAAAGSLREHWREAPCLYDSVLPRRTSSVKNTGS